MAAPELVGLDDGLQVFASSSIEARFLYQEIFLDCCYDPVDLRQRPFVIDAGANIGMFALFVKLRYPDAEILAFEPAPDTAAVLRQNISLHTLSGVTVREVALGSAPEQGAPFIYYPALPGNSTRYPGLTGSAKAVLGRAFSPRVAERLFQGREISVPVERLSAFLAADRPVDLVKIDVEGAELDVLGGIDAAHWPLIGQAIVEVTDHGDQLAAVCDLLGRHGLKTTVERSPQADTDLPTHIVHACRLLRPARPASSVPRLFPPGSSPSSGRPGQPAPGGRRCGIGADQLRQPPGVDHEHPAAGR